MEYQFHELSYMQSSLDLLQTKDEIEQLLREQHMVDKKLEAKTREQNDLTEKCMSHIRVLRKKGMTGDFYSPKKHGISATPTKAMSGSYTPNYVPSNYIANHPTEHVASALVQGGPWSPVRYAQYTPPKLGSTSTIIPPRGGLLGNYPATKGPSNHTPYATGQGYTTQSNISAVAVSQFPSPVQGKQSLIVKKCKIDNPDREMTDDELLEYLEPDEEGNTNANSSPTASQNKPQVKHFKKEHTNTKPKGAPAKHQNEHTNGNGGQSNGAKNDSGAPQNNPEINSGDGGQNDNEINDGGILQGKPNVGGQEKEDSDKKPGPASVK